MKNTIIVIFTFISIGLKAQTGIITYKVSSLNEKKTDLIDKIKAEMELMEFTLTFHEDKSFFKKEKNIYKDTRMGKLALIFLNAQHNYSQENKKSYSEFNVKNTDYLTNRSYRMSNWELTNETTTINNYKCYKAKLKEYNKRNENYFEITAWYTPDIPAGYGPIGFGGLPGLILQLEYNKSVFTAKSVIQNPENVKVASLKKGDVITYDEMVKLMRAARKVTPD